MTDIVQLGAAVLRRHADAVKDVHNPHIRSIIRAMEQKLAGTEGVGLAAPQIGESVRIIIVASRPTLRYPKAPVMAPTVMINPVFEPIHAGLEKDWEGCLSIPGIRALVPRFSSIRIAYQDVQGGEHKSELEGFIARVFQHEADHLDGKVYLDRVEHNGDIVAESEYFKRVS
jgi:peptide deformylase